MDSHWFERIYNIPGTTKTDIEYRQHPENNYPRFKKDLYNLLNEMDTIQAHLTIYLDQPKIFDEIDHYRRLNVGFLTAFDNIIKEEDKETYNLLKTKNEELVHWSMKNGPKTPVIPHPLRPSRKQIPKKKSSSYSSSSLSYSSSSTPYPPPPKIKRPTLLKKH
jgi:hypothetical protein